MPDPVLSLAVFGALVGGLFVLFRPRGLFHRWRRTRWMTERVLSEDALKHIFKCRFSGERPTLESVAGALNITVSKAVELLASMEKRELLRLEGNHPHLTVAGRDAALHIIRAHRLWERYLADRTGYAEAEWHDRAERFEHRLTEDEANELAARLGNPIHDPHGAPIPSASGELVPHGGKPLTSMKVDAPLRIVHIEDEPEAVYAQIVAERLHPGMQVQLGEVTPERVRFWADGDEHLLAPIVAANISVVPIPERPAEEAEQSIPGDRLSSLEPGERGEVMSISRACRGEQRRRLMDFGIVSGTLVEAAMRSPAGDPTAYRVRDALIALHREQADLIRIRRVSTKAS